MIRIQQLKLPVEHTEEELAAQIARTLRLRPGELLGYEILRRSVDARKKPELFYVYQLDVRTAREKEVLRRAKKSGIEAAHPVRYRPPAEGSLPLSAPPVVVGSGPAGLFAAWLLARQGYRPLVLERGDPAPLRREKVERFWATGRLDPDSNVQFGEGGAGTFSDGKLNTSVKDPSGRNREVLRILVSCGAPQEILYEQKAHLGTDQLIGIVGNLRREIEQAGGRVRFRSAVTDLIVRNGRLWGVEVNGRERIETPAVILAVGHSARDTYALLARRGVPLAPKAFAVGLRIEHPQEMITRLQYGDGAPARLGAAPYKVTARASGGRGVYSFCMCPGGYVVNASSEELGLCVNGMSNSAREGRNANSAMIVTVTPEDYAADGADAPIPALSGVAFQRRLERAAFRAGEGEVPVQLFGDFERDMRSAVLGDVQPAIRGAWRFADLRRVLPGELSQALIEGILLADAHLPGFARRDAVLSGVEARTSSPVRILRNDAMESVGLPGLYPAGEGAGYAGGITSAAIDGLKAAEAVCAKYRNFNH